MTKWLVGGKEDLGSFVNHYRQYRFYASPLDYLPDRYPCILVSFIIDNPDGQDWVVWEYVFKDDFDG